MLGAAATVWLEHAPCHAIGTVFAVIGPALVAVRATSVDSQGTLHAHTIVAIRASAIGVA